MTTPATTYGRRKLKTATRLVTDRASSEPRKVGLENIEGWTGRLVSAEGSFDGDGVSFKAGDVLFGKLRPYLAKAWVADGPGAAVGDFLVLRPSGDLDSRFLLYSLLSPEQIELIAGSVYGAKMPRASWDFIRELDVWFPPLAAQREIVTKLDSETAEIDAFIADQEELIGLLTERREVIRTTHFERVVDLTAGGGAKPPLGVAITETDKRVGTEERELMSVSIHRGLVPWTHLHDKAPKAVDFATYKCVEPGDLVLNRMRAFQGAAGVSRQRGMVSPDYAVFKVSQRCDPEYIGELLRSTPMIEAIKLRLRGIGDTDSGAVRTPRVNVRDLVRIRVELPDRPGQKRAVLALRREAAELDAAIADAREAIALSRERRAALITAAVTGKFDVRDVA